MVAKITLICVIFYRLLLFVAESPCFPPYSTDICSEKLKNMRTTALFDMDGLLLDTEPLWGESMLRVAAQHKIPVTLSQFRETTGLRIHEVTAYWARHYPWQGASSERVAEDILDDIIALAHQKGRVMPGAIAALQLCKEQHITIGLASSSPQRMIDGLIRHFGLLPYFDGVFSADAVTAGKPHPAVFLHAAERLSGAPQDCIVFEDSINGMIAGKAARMKVVVVPDSTYYDHPGFSLADVRLRSLSDFHAAML